MDVDGYLKRAAEALRRRQPDKAAAYCRQVLVARPGHPEAWKLLLAAHRRRAQLRGGPSLLDKAAVASLKPLALGLRGQARHEAVVATCTKGLARHPADPTLLTLLAAALEERGDVGAALAVLETRLEDDAQDVEALKAAARLYHGLREIDAALSCLERARAVDPHDPEIERRRKDLAAEDALRGTRDARGPIC